MGLASRWVSRACCPLPLPESSQCQRKPAPCQGRASALRPWSHKHRVLPTFPTGFLLHTGPGLSVPPQAHCPRGKACTLTLGVAVLPTYMVSLQPIFAYFKVPTILGSPFSLGHAKLFPYFVGPSFVIYTPPTLWLAPSLFDPGSHVTP